MQLQPTLNKKIAYKISNEIHMCHSRIGIDKFLLTAIYNQESQINYKAKNSLKGIFNKSSLESILKIIRKNISFPFNEKRLKEDLTHVPFKVCFDLGIGQININTALRYRQCSDLNRLTSDYKYNISCSCAILQDFKRRYSHKEKEWWTRYNARDPEKREIYRQLVMRYYPVKKRGNTK